MVKLSKFLQEKNAYSKLVTLPTSRFDIDSNEEQR